MAILRRLLQSPVLVFILLATLFGVLSVVVEPPFAVNDEITHFSRAYEVANGTFLTKKVPNSPLLGGSVPHAFTNLDGSLQYVYGLKPNITEIEQASSIARGVSINSPDRVTIPYSNTALYSPFSYTIQALVILFSRFTNISVLATFYLARLAMLAAYIIVVSLALHISPVKRWFLLAIALLPMCIQEAASVSIDGLLIASSLLFLGSFLAMYVRRTATTPLGKREINLLAVACISILYVSLAKAVYFPLFLIICFLPTEVLGSGWREKGKRLTWILGMPFILTLVWNLFTSHQGAAEASRLTVGSVGIYPPTLKIGVISLLHLGYTLPLLFHTYVDQPLHQTIPDFIAGGFFGRFSTYFITTPIWYEISVCLPLLLGFFLKEPTKLRFFPPLLVTLSAALLIVWLGITFSMFFAATSAGQNYINGIQGRYFIPLVGFLLFFIGQEPIITITNRLKSKAFLTGFTCFNLVFMQLFIYQWFWKG